VTISIDGDVGSAINQLSRIYSLDRVRAFNLADVDTDRKWVTWQKLVDSSHTG